MLVYRLSLLKKREECSSEILFMVQKSGDHQLRLVVYQGFIHPKWLAGFLNHQQDENGNAILTPNLSNECWPLRHFESGVPIISNATIVH